VDVASVGTIFETTVPARENVDVLAGQVAREIRLAQNGLAAGISKSHGRRASLQGWSIPSRHRRHCRQWSPRRLLRRLEHDEVCRKRAASTVVKVDDGVLVVDLEDGSPAEARMNDTVAPVP
jgi:hypothetical protein